MKITTLVEPAGAAVSMEQARAFLRVDYGGEDELIASLINAAQARLENQTALRCVTQTVRVDWPCVSLSAVKTGWLALPVGPVRNVVSITADGMDVSGQFEQAFGRRAGLTPLSGTWPVEAQGDLSVTLEVGFGAPEDVPSDIVLAIKLLIQKAYLQRSEANVADTLDEEVSALLAPWRMVRL